MKKIIIFCLLTLGGLSVAFGQLRVANDSGKNLKVIINGQTEQIPNKGISTFNTRSRKVTLECLDQASKLKVTLNKEVNRSGLVTIIPSDLQVTQTSVTQPVYETQTVYSAPPTSSGTSLSNILSGSGSGSSTKQTSSTRTVTTNSYSAPTTSSYSTTSVVTTPTSQNRMEFRNIPVVYTGSERIKVFSNLGGGRWQGIEFKGQETTDSTDNTKNRYLLPVPSDQDQHVGFIFNPNDAVNAYGEFRKRVNREDTVLYISEISIKKMSTNETKLVRINFMAQGYKILFIPKPGVKGKKDPISLEYRQKSRQFEVPIGQFYLKVSCTNEAKNMFLPTLYIPVHVTNRDVEIKIKASDIEKGLNKDLNLFW